MKETYEPAAQEEIEQYTNKTYPDWVTACEKQLRALHEVLQARADVPTCRLVARNTGSRPATDALVSIQPQGRFDVCRARRDEDRDEDEDEDGMLRLPSPPTAPRGEWTNAPFQRGTRSAMEEFRRVFAGREHFLDPHRGFQSYHDIRLPEPPDPNAFYFKSLTHRSGDGLQLTCDQWRHGVEAHAFAAAIVVPADATEVAGAIQFRIDAENLPDAVVRVFPLRLKVITADTVAVARTLIDDLGATADDGRRPG